MCLCVEGGGRHGAGVASRGGHGTSTAVSVWTHKGLRCKLPMLMCRGCCPSRCTALPCPAVAGRPSSRSASTPLPSAALPATHNPPGQHLLQACNLGLGCCRLGLHPACCCLSLIRTVQGIGLPVLGVTHIKLLQVRAAGGGRMHARIHGRVHGWQCGCPLQRRLAAPAACTRDELMMPLAAKPSSHGSP